MKIEEKKKNKREKNGELWADWKGFGIFQFTYLKTIILVLDGIEYTVGMCFLKRLVSFIYFCTASNIIIFACSDNILFPYKRI